jgi:alpha-L-rhamnosidase
MTGLSPYGLTCELLATPLGVGEGRPRLSWKLTSPTRGDRQTGYRIRVAERVADLAAGERLRWDSGPVAGEETLHHGYDGEPLVSSTRYHWSVQVTDAQRRPAGEARSWFETGLLHPDEWRAAWIGRDPHTQPMMEPPRDDADGGTARTRHLEPPLRLRRSFDLPGPVVRARLYVTARGIHRTSLNGTRVGDDELTPGWTDYRRRIHYHCHDVTAMLGDGENVLSAVVADGWWSGFIGFDARRAAHHYGTAPEYLAQLLVDFADGSRRTVVSDGRWRERPGPIRYADLLMGESVDAGLAVDGWDRPGFDDADWPAVSVLGEDTAVLVAAPDAPVRVVAELPARSVTTTGAVTLIDFGQNLVGRVRLTLRGLPAGTRLRLRHGETLAGDGTLYVANLRTAEATDRYVTAGAPVEVFEPLFTVHGFRYAELTGHPGGLSDVDATARVLSQDLPAVGEFDCSDGAVLRLVSNIGWSQRGNFVSVPTDCPQRDERLGWLADAQVFLPTAARTADVSAFFARWLADVLDGQDADGAFRDVAPALLLDREAAPGWGDGGVVIPWHLYRTYGDRRVLRRSFGAMTAWVDHVHRHNPNLIWRHRVGNHYGDWLQVGVSTPRELLATAYFARSAELVSRAAQALDEPAAAKKYADLHAAVRDAFVTAFVAADGRVHGDTQTGYLLALAFGLLPDRLVAAAAGHLAADVEARGRHLSTGFLGVALLCPVLTEHGRADLAYALLQQDGYPSWLYSVDRGATTIWERWDGWTADAGFQAAAMNSFNHYSLGSVGDWLHGRVAGIDQEDGSVAYRRLLLRPTVGGRLTWARARYDSPRGEIACGWRRSGPRLRLDVTVPPGATARVHVPTTDPGSVRLDGAPVAGAVESTVDGVVLAVAAGSYQITSRYER